MKVSSIAKMAATAALTTGFAVTALPAQADPGAVVHSGTCYSANVTGPVTWSLAAQPVNGNIEVHAQVHSNVVGQNWQYRIVKMTPAVHSGPIANSNGAHQVVAKGTISTHNPNGAFQVRVLTEDRSGPEKITFRAVNAATNTVCSGSLVV